MNANPHPSYDVLMRSVDSRESADRSNQLMAARDTVTRTRKAIERLERTIDAAVKSRTPAGAPMGIPEASARRELAAARIERDRATQTIRELSS